MIAASHSTPSTPVSRLGWIKRRARRIERFYLVSRKLAVYDARLDWLDYAGQRGLLGARA